LKTRLAKLYRPAALVVLALGTLLTLRGDKTRAETISLQGPSATIPATYFGMHAHRLVQGTPWPTVSFGVLRLWDTGTTWSDLEPQKNEWRFNKLDRLVLLAAEHQTEVLLCFGKTPQWASSITSSEAIDDSDKQFQTGAPANLDDWRTFVTTLASRYKGKIKAYEVWNEPSARNFYQGDVGTMVQMTRIASETIHSVDPGAIVVSPSATGTNGLRWLDQFLAQGGGHYVDVIGYHLYVTPEAPEQIPPLAAAVKSLLQRYNVALPLWNTETGWSSPKTFPADSYEASAYVARSYLLTWAAGVSRFYWYAWDNRDWCTLYLTTNDNHANLNADAYATVESWMVGNKLDLCSNDANHTWTCHLSGEAGDMYIFWNPDHQRSYRLPGNVNKGREWQLVDLYGKVSPAGEGTLIADQQPRLLRQTKH
jgi:hypothetical protein